MDALKGKKLVMKESDGKALAATIKVAFEQFVLDSKHLKIEFTITCRRTFFFRFAIDFCHLINQLL